MKISINLNERVKVKLTEYGKGVLAGAGYSLREDKDGYADFQLWSFMQIFGGEHSGVCRPNTVEDLMIYFGDVSQ